MIHISDKPNNLTYIYPPRGWNEEAINLSRISRNRLHPGNLLRPWDTLFQLQWKGK